MFNPMPKPLSKLQKIQLKKEKSESSKSLIDEADRLFSLLVRLRDSDQYGRGSCITCGKIQEVKHGHCGHFISREQLPTRWELKNANFQCVQCNLFKSGKQYEHSLAINEKFGEGTAEAMRIKSHNIFKKEPMILKLIIMDLQNRLSTLRKERGLE